MADDTGSQDLLSSIAASALSFATPFAQKVFGSSSTPQQVQNDTLRTAALNGSGPNDPTLSTQSPLGLWDFITGGRVTGASGGTKSGGGGLTSGTNLTFIGIIVIAIVAVVVILKR